MLNPGRSLIIWLAVLVTGAILVAVGFHPSMPLGNGPLGVGIAVSGVMMIPVGIGFSIWALLVYRGQSKLRQGHRLIARWQVSDADWRKFIDFDRTRAASELHLANDFNAEKLASGAALEIVVGETGIAIGKYYQTLRRGGLPALQAVHWLPEPADPQCLEFHIVYPRRYGPGTRLCLRAPVPAAAHEAGRRVLEHFSGLFRPSEPLALRSPAMTTGISLAIATASAAGAAWGLAQGDPASEGGVIALMTGVVCAIVAVTALVFAATAFIMSRSRSAR